MAKVARFLLLALLLVVLQTEGVTVAGLMKSVQSQWSKWKAEGSKWKARWSKSLGTPSADAATAIRFSKAGEKFFENKAVVAISDTLGIGTVRAAIDSGLHLVEDGAKNFEGAANAANELQDKIDEIDDIHPESPGHMPVEVENRGRRLASASEPFVVSHQILLCGATLQFLHEELVRPTGNPTSTRVASTYAKNPHFWSQVFMMIKKDFNVEHLVLGPDFESEPNMLAEFDSNSDVPPPCVAKEDCSGHGTTTDQDKTDRGTSTDDAPPPPCTEIDCINLGTRTDDDKTDDFDTTYALCAFVVVVISIGLLLHCGPHSGHSQGESLYKGLAAGDHVDVVETKKAFQGVESLYFYFVLGDGYLIVVSLYQCTSVDNPIWQRWCWSSLSFEFAVDFAAALRIRRLAHNWGSPADTMTESLLRWWSEISLLLHAVSMTQWMIFRLALCPPNKYAEILLVFVMLVRLSKFVPMCDLWRSSNEICGSSRMYKLWCSVTEVCGLFVNRDSVTEVFGRLHGWQNENENGSFVNHHSGHQRYRFLTSKFLNTGDTDSLCPKLSKLVFAASGALLISTGLLFIMAAQQDEQALHPDDLMPPPESLSDPPSADMTFSPTFLSETPPTCVTDLSTVKTPSCLQDGDYIFSCTTTCGKNFIKKQHVDHRAAGVVMGAGGIGGAVCGGIAMAAGAETFGASFGLLALCGGSIGAGGWAGYEQSEHGSECEDICGGSDGIPSFIMQNLWCAQCDW